MGKLDSVKTEVFVRFLRLLGLKEFNKKGSHVKWKKPGQHRSCVIRPALKEISHRHIKTNLQSVGVEIDVFEKWLDGEYNDEKIRQDYR